MEDNLQIFYKRFRELVESSGRSRKELVEIFNINPASLYKWVQGMASPRLEALPLIAKEFGVSVDYLLGIKDDKYVNSIPPASDQTGLSPKALRNLINICETKTDGEYLNRAILEKIFVSKKGSSDLSEASAEYIAAKGDYFSKKESLKSKIDAAKTAKEAEQYRAELKELQIEHRQKIKAERLNIYLQLISAMDAAAKEIYGADIED